MRLMLVSVVASALVGAACSKSTETAARPNPAAGNAVVGEKIAPPGEKIAPPGAEVGAPGQAEGVGAGAAPSDASYAVTIEPVALKAGQKGAVKINVKPGAGYHINLDFPIKLAFDAVPAELALDKTTLEKADVARLDENGLGFAVATTAQKAGSYTLKGKLKFAVCTDTTCDPKTETLAIQVAAE